jgi:osmotically-inducible protein OsmY
MLASFSGCAVFQGEEKGDRTAGRVVDDTHLVTKVKDALKSEPVYKFSDVDVKAYNGVVQLSGFVNSQEQKQRAAELAQRVEGVAQVVNSIALKPEVPTPTGRIETPPPNR